MTTSTMPISLDGWDITRAADTDWVPWGEGGHARAKVLGTADGYLVALVEADAGYTGTPHEHSNAEFLYVVEGRLRNQGRTMESGDGYAAAAGSTHVDFAAEQPSRYLSIFKL
jgi:quercetin dioxygenase-like cupin family protein